jgi:hypothetical protein
MTSVASFLASSLVRVTVGGARLDPLYMIKMWLAAIMGWAAAGVGAGAGAALG